MRTATQDLATKLTDVNAKLESLLVRGKKSSPVVTCYNECENAEKYTSDCSEVLGRDYQGRLRPTLTGGNDDPEHDTESISLRQLMVANIITLAASRELNKGMSDIQNRLQVHEENIAGDRFAGVGPTAMSSSRRALRPASEHSHTTQLPSDCPDASRIVSPKRFHSIEDVIVGKDSRVIFMSALGEVVNAKRISAGDRALLLIGSCSDTTVQACVGDF